MVGQWTSSSSITPKDIGKGFEYDAVGNRTKRTDYIGRETTYEYDVLNRLKKINYLPTTTVGVQPQPTEMPIQTATYNYDDLSRLVSAVNQAGMGEAITTLEMGPELYNTTD